MTISKYDQLNSKLVALMEQGVSPWQPNWDRGGDNLLAPKNPVTGTKYSGVNTAILFMEYLNKSYTTNLWVTFNQAKKLGWSVIKGSKGTSITFAKKAKRKVEEGEDEDYFFCSWYTVFNFDQIDDSKSTGKKKSDYLPKQQDKVVRENLAIDSVEKLIKKLQPEIIVSEAIDVPCYIPSIDQIRMPSINLFHSSENYYSTLLHELVHWSGHKSRCDRHKERESKSEYAYEELVAELGSLYLCLELGIVYRIEHHASYLASWSKFLTEDGKAFFRASKEAQKAVKFLLG